MRNMRTTLTWGWTIWAHLCGLVVIAVGVGYGIVYSVSDETWVVRMVDGPGIRETEPRIKVKAGGVLEYKIVMERSQSCPGEVLYTFRSLESRDGVVITTRRGVRNFNAIDPYKTAVGVELPGNVTPGLWTFESGVDSKCPLFSKYDKLASMLVEVVK